MKITYLGSKCFKAVTRDQELIIDQPTEYGGTNKGFTPPELLIASLGSCVGVYVENFCLRHEIDISKMEIDLQWEKVMEPTRLDKINCQVSIPTVVDENKKKAIQKVAEQCLIHNTLHNEPEINISVEVQSD